MQIVADYNAFKAIQNPKNGDFIQVGNSNLQGIFKYDSSLSSENNGGTVINGWVRQFTGKINVRWFGAKGHHPKDQEDQKPDDTIPIQKAIDYAIKETIGAVYIPSGRYKITNTIHLGYGTPVKDRAGNFMSVSIYGDGTIYKGEESFGGTLLDASSFSDRMAINVQGQRNCELANFSIIGANYNFINTNGQGNINNSNTPDLEPEDWVDESLHSNADSQTAPYAGVAIDAYSGIKPINNFYPNVNYPEFLVADKQYNKSQSSVIKFTNIEIYGFVVGVVSQPNNNFDANGDFITFHNTGITRCAYGISIGQSQARQLNITGNSRIALVHTCITTKTHGKKIGKISGSIDGLNTELCIQVFNLNGSRGALNISGGYGEAIYRLGYFGDASSNNIPGKLIRCEYNFSLQNRGLRGIPNFCIDGNRTSLFIDSCAFSLSIFEPFDDNEFTTNKLDASIVVNPKMSVVVTNSKFFSDRKDPEDKAEAVYKNYIQGGIFCPKIGSSEILTQFKGYTISNLAPDNSFEFQTTPDKSPGRDINLPRKIKNFPVSVNNQMSFRFDLNETGNSINGTSWDIINSNGSEITVDIKNSERHRIFYKIDLGDLLYQNQTLYRVINRKNTIITIKAISNINADGSLNSPITKSDGIHYFHSRLYCLKELYYADFKAGSNIVNFYRAKDGANAGSIDEVEKNDRLFITNDMIGIFPDISEAPRVKQIFEEEIERKIDGNTVEITTKGAFELELTINNNKTKTVKNSKSNVPLYLFSRTFESI